MLKLCAMEGFTGEREGDGVSLLNGLREGEEARFWLR